MIEQLKAYSDFKATGLPWLERIPSHWNLIPNRALVRLRRRLVGRNHRRYRLLSLTKPGIVVRDVVSGKGKFSSDMGTSQEVREGDLVFCFFDVPETPRTVGLSPHHGMITGAYTVLEPLRLGVAPYFELFYRAMDDSKMLSPLYSGLRNTIPVDRFLVTKTPLPPPEEQEAIVRFLDHANRHIDQFIQEKKKLITLLNEQKQAIIHRAVTGGISSDSQPRLERDVFLGRVPRQWPMKRAKYLFRQVVAPVPENAEQVTCFRDGQVTLRKNRRTTGYTEAIYELGYQGIFPGQLVVHSMDAFAGAIGVSDSCGKCSPEYVILEPQSKDVDSNYYALLLRHLAVRGLFKALCPSVRERAPRVRFNDFGSFALPVPPLDEQFAIVAHIKQASIKLDAALKNARDQVNRVQEYRTRLVSDVVTGQFDVRATAAGMAFVAPPEAPPSDSEGDETDIEQREAA